MSIITRLTFASSGPTNDMRTTYNRYGKVVPEDLAPAAAQLDTYFASHRTDRLATEA